jgi:hypothetical protein
MRNGTIIGIVVLICGYVAAHPAWVELTKDKTQGMFQELAITYSGATVRLGGHIPIRDAPTWKKFEDSTQTAQVPQSNRCVTPTFYCFLPRYAPVGVPCWCASPYGPVGGVVK